VTTLAVRVQPGARRAEIRGWMEDGAVKIAVTAAPEGGRANEALIEMLAEVLDVRERALSFKRGQSSRSKVIEIEGLTAAQVKQRIERAMQGEKRRTDGE
jgi:uncharacterized protein